jgi:hypothetical protein
VLLCYQEPSPLRHSFSFSLYFFFAPKNRFNSSIPFHFHEHIAIALFKVSKKRWIFPFFTLDLLLFYESMWCCYMIRWVMTEILMEAYKWKKAKRQHCNWEHISSKKKNFFFLFWERRQVTCVYAKEIHRREKFNLILNTSNDKFIYDDRRLLFLSPKHLLWCVMWCAMYQKIWQSFDENWKKIDEKHHRFLSFVNFFSNSSSFFHSFGFVMYSCDVWLSFHISLYFFLSLYCDIIQEWWKAIYIRSCIKL